MMDLNQKRHILDMSLSDVVQRLTLILFLIFFIHTLIIGGDAMNGLHAKNIYENYVSGRYYVASRHGFIEVSMSSFYINLSLGILTILGFVMSFALNVINRYK